MSTRRYSLIVLLGAVLALGFQGAPSSGVVYRFTDVRPGGQLDRFRAKIYTMLYYGYPPSPHAATLASKDHSIRYNGEMGTYAHEVQLEWTPSDGQPIYPVWAVVIDLNHNIVVANVPLDPQTP
jgi:hypothetical protein